MRPELVAALNVGLAIAMQINLAKRKKVGTLESWIPWQSLIVGLHLSGLMCLVGGLPGKTSNWLAYLLLAALFACFAHFAFAVLRNGPAYRRQQALLQKQQESAVNSPVAVTVTPAEIKQGDISDTRRIQQESQILKDSQVLKRFR